MESRSVATLNIRREGFTTYNSSFNLLQQNCLYKCALKQKIIINNYLAWQHLGKLDSNLIHEVFRNKNSTLCHKAGIQPYHSYLSNLLVAFLVLVFFFPSPFKRVPLNKDEPLIDSRMLQKFELLFCNSSCQILKGHLGCL